MSTQERFAAALRNWALQLTVCVSSVTFTPAITSGQLAAQLDNARAVLTRHLQTLYHCQPLGLTVAVHLREACSNMHPVRPVFSDNRGA